jgi:hypothetical protein
MLEVDSPWLVNLAATLKDDRNIYMLLEAVLGGELFAYLQVATRGHGSCFSRPSGAAAFWRCQGHERASDGGALETARRGA